MLLCYGLVWRQGMGRSTRELEMLRQHGLLRAAANTQQTATSGRRRHCRRCICCRRLGGLDQPSASSIALVPRAVAGVAAAAVTA